MQLAPLEKRPSRNSLFVASLTRGHWDRTRPRWASPPSLGSSCADLNVRRGRELRVAAASSHPQSSNFSYPPELQDSTPKPPNPTPTAPPSTPTTTTTTTPSLPFLHLPPTQPSTSIRLSLFITQLLCTLGSSTLSLALLLNLFFHLVSTLQHQSHLS